MLLSYYIEDMDCVVACVGNQQEAGAGVAREWREGQPARVKTVTKLEP
jgi:hypothetical protein